MECREIENEIYGTSSWRVHPDGKLFLIVILVT